MPPVLFTDAEPPQQKKPETLLDLYFGGSVARIAADLETRPEHYGKDYVELVRALERGDKPPAAAVNDLVLQFMRTTQAATSTRAAIAKVTKPEVDENDIPVYEEQDDIKGAITII